MAPTVRVKVTRAFWLRGSTIAAGSEITLPVAEAQAVLASGRAVADDPPAAAKAIREHQTRVNADFMRAAGRAGSSWVRN